MKVIIKILLLMAISMALTITLTMRTIDQSPLETLPIRPDEKKHVGPFRPVSRFLAEKERNPRAADHCRRDNEICEIMEGKNAKCCNNKCMDLDSDEKNCGACKKKCRFGEVCCRGECVDLSFDKRHCGQCNNKCAMKDGYCIYGMCDYA